MSNSRYISDARLKTLNFSGENIKLLESRKIEKNQEKSTSEKNEKPDIEHAVLNFFLKLYTIQLGITEEDHIDSDIICLNPEFPGLDHTYELRIKGKEFKSRRMALGPLGENSGSKSKCFKVVYDDILVVKIPPRPITQFDEYVESINIERQIAEKLKPDIECIAPSISAILKKNSLFLIDYDLSTKELEEKYIELLRKSPWLQDYLKIDGAFVFFMNLSKHSFLSHVIEKMHNFKTKVHEEILSQTDILWNPIAFEGVYGEANASIYFKINEIYNEYEEKTNLLLRKRKINPSLFMYKRKEWFLIHLADGKITHGERNLKLDFFDDMNNLFKRIFKFNKAEIMAYRKMMEEYVYEKMFKQNKAQCKGIITNILELLYWLRIKGVAIRDLKPDNIFVVGSCFLQNPCDFSLGLIDFETAVTFKVPINKEIDQPLPAGTPSYATPSHLTSNKVLKDTLDSLPHVLHLQDWHAAIGMIFYVVTGERLFEKTRRWFAETGQTIQESSKKDISLPDSFKKCSRLFWYSAFNEFREKINANRKILEALDIVVPVNAKGLLRQELIEERMDIVKKIQNFIHSQNFFKSEKSHHDLINSNYSTINRCRRNWETGVNVPKTRPEIRAQIIKLLQNLEQLKLDFENRSLMIKLLLKDSPVITIYSLLELMFNIIFNAMYKQEWGDISDETMTYEAGKEIALTADETVSFEKGNLEKTFSYEETVSYEGVITNEENVSYEKTISFENTAEADTTY